MKTFPNTYGYLQDIELQQHSSIILSSEQMSHKFDKLLWLAWDILNVTIISIKNNNCNKNNKNKTVIII